MIEKVLFEVSFRANIQYHIGIRTFHQLYVLTLLVPIWSAPQRRPEPPPPPSNLYIDPI